MTRTANSAAHEMMSKDEILALFIDSKALLNGHFQLTSGLHSSTYFQCAKVLQYPKNAEMLCGMIARRYQDRNVDAVIAPAIGGIVVGQEVGRQLGVRTIFAERKEGVMQLRRGFEILSNENVLVCEDVITTGGSVNEVIGIVNNAGARIAGVGAVVDRSGGTVSFDNFFTAISMDVITYYPVECPQCKEGLPIDKPGSRHNT